jgi:prepilin-type N-terminal cleavage/methylation domain-containing protein
MRRNASFFQHARFVAGRRGVTLLEVLMAMGVMSIGLMGLAALIPLGRLELAEGDRMDNSSNLGRAAFREVTVRGYLRPELWADPVTGGSVVTPTNFVFSQSATMPPNAPIVIDPLMIAPKYFGETPNGSALVGNEQTHRQNARVFPYSFNLPGGASGGPENSGNKPMVARVTLRSYPSNVVSSGASPAFTMRYDVAQKYFRSSDDLVFTLTSNKELTPMQSFQASAQSLLTVTTGNSIWTTTTPNAAFRQFRGDYSWFMVAQPSQAEMWSQTDTLMPAFGGKEARPSMARQFRAWVVVCHQRDLRETTGMDLTDDPVVGERAVWVDFVDSVTARLRVHGINSPQTAARVLDVKMNHWIAVIGRCQNPLLAEAGYGQTQYGMEWYRLTSVSAETQVLPNGTTWYREVTLAGRDFTDPLITPSGTGYLDADTGTSYPDVASEPLTGWGVVISGVRGVYEKSIFVDRPSLWTPAQ